MLAYDNIFSAIEKSDAEKLKNILNSSSCIKPFFVNFIARKRKSSLTENKVKKFFFLTFEKEFRIFYK